MPALATRISFDDINSAFLGVEYLILTADYAMWLHIEYEGKPDSVLVDLVQEPEDQRTAAIDQCLCARRAELSVQWLRCTQCQKNVLDLGETSCEICRGQLHPEFMEEETLRNRAWDRVMWSDPGAHARYTVPHWLLEGINPGGTARPAECSLPRSRVFSLLGELVKNFQEKHMDGCWEHLYIEGPWSLLPKGSSFQERHRDYLVTRGKLTACYNWLTGMAHQHPEFTEDSTSHPGIRTFPPAVGLGVAVLAEPNDAGNANTAMGTPVPVDTEASIAGIGKPVDDQDGDETSGESSKANMSYEEVAKRLEQLRQQGEVFTSQRTLENQLGCSLATINKAIKSEESLKAWAKPKPKKTTAPRAQSLNNVVTDNAPQRTEPDPSDVLEPDDIDKMLRYVIEQAGPEERDRINGMPPDKQEELARLAFDDPDRSNQILNRQP